MPTWAKWMPHAPQLTPFLHGVSAFASAYVNLDEPEEAQYRKPKSIADPVVGYIHLEPWEVTIIDTALFQRLRRIHQLGLASLIYPTLTYSRFDHSIGVLGRLNEILVRLRADEGDISQTVGNTIRHFAVAVRLAALFHDVGHCLFSHVSERVMSTLTGHARYPSALTVRQMFTEHFRRRHLISLAEVLSVTILGTSTIRDLLMRSEAVNRKGLADEMTEAAAHFIIGMPMKDHPESTFLGQLISSPLDADKLDYMPREVHFSGLNTTIDLPRLLEKLRVFDLAVDQLPRGLRWLTKVFGAHARFLTLGLGRGGQFAFEEFCLARVGLYEKIYLHQKVRAAESELEQRLRRLPMECTEYQEVHRWLYLEESLKDSDVTPLPQQLAGLFTPQARTSADVDISFIRDRRLLHRAFAIGPANSLSDPPNADALLPDDIPSLRLMHQLRGDSDSFVAQVIHETDHLRALLSLGIGAIGVEQLVFDAPRYMSVQQDHESVVVQKADRLPVRWTMPIDRLVDYYQKHRALAYIFAPRAAAALVAVAAEMVVWRTTQMVFVQDDALAPDIVTEMHQHKRTLAATSYYANATVLKPLSGYLATAEAQERIQQLSARLARFESFKGERVTLSRITSYVTQFPSDLHEVTIHWLEQLEMIEESDLESALSEALAIDPDTAHKTFVVPFGGLGDSAVHLVYPIREGVAKERIRLLDDATVADAKRIVFFDDNVNTGKQVINVFAQWLDVKLPANVDLREAHVWPLSPQSQARLRSIPIVLVFAVGTEGADRAVETLFTEHLNMTNVQVRIGKQLLARRKVFSGPDAPFQDERRIELRNFVTQKGVELLQARGKTREEADRRCLGYGGAEAMVLFPYNVPTMTVTCLWLGGDGESNWLPLIERRRRQNTPDEA
jgi:deoxynucleoside triphosphate triphosphohydrolase SAMHD1